MKPFLLIQSRPETDVADDEYQAFLRYMQLDEPQLERWRIDQQSLPDISLTQYSGILVAGGPFNVYYAAKSDNQLRLERELTDLLARIYEADFPYLGVCYGMGILTQYLGAVTDNTYGEPVVAVTQRIVEHDPLLEGIDDTFDAFVGHKEACLKTPEQATLLVTSDPCPVQMYRLKSNIYATQFHPELDADGLAIRIAIYKNHGYFPADEADALIQAARSANTDSAPIILRNFALRFGSETASYASSGHPSAQQTV